MSPNTVLCDQDPRSLAPTPATGKWISGKRLRAADRHYVLGRHQERSTGDHPNRGAGPLQFRDDEEWLAYTLFAVTNDGSLDRRFTTCFSWPTWPNNPELR